MLSAYTLDPQICVIIPDFILGFPAEQLRKNVAQQMLKNPKIEISGMADGKWIRLTAEAVLDERIEAQESMLDANPALKSMYKAGDGNTAVFYLKNAIATFCSFTEEPRTVTF